MRRARNFGSASGHSCNSPARLSTGPYRTAHTGSVHSRMVLAVDSSVASPAGSHHQQLFIPSRASPTSNSLRNVYSTERVSQYEQEDTGCAIAAV